MMTRIILLAAPVLFTAAMAVGDSVILRHSVRITETGDTIHLADIATPQRVETTHGLIEDNQLGISHQRLRNTGALHHPLRILLNFGTEMAI